MLSWPDDEVARLRVGGRGSHCCLRGHATRERDADSCVRGLGEQVADTEVAADVAHSRCGDARGVNTLPAGRCGRGLAGRAATGRRAAASGGARVCRCSGLRSRDDFGDLVAREGDDAGLGAVDRNLGRGDEVDGDLLGGRIFGGFGGRTGLSRRSLGLDRGGAKEVGLSLAGVVAIGDSRGNDDACRCDSCNRGSSREAASRAASLTRDECCGLRGTDADRAAGECLWDLDDLSELRLGLIAGDLRQCRGRRKYGDKRAELVALDVRRVVHERRRGSQHRWRRVDLCDRRLDHRRGHTRDTDSRHWALARAALDLTSLTSRQRCRGVRKVFQVVPPAPDSGSRSRSCLLPGEARSRSGIRRLGLPARQIA
ncbi:hypothetical protein ACFPRL_26540 [Pseudoclavibacter helvolus]